MTDDQELAKLQDPETWDWDHPIEVRVPPKGPRRTRLSLDLDSGDFERLFEHVHSRGIRLTTFVIEAALERLAQEQSAAADESQQTSVRR